MRRDDVFAVLRGRRLVWLASTAGLLLTLALTWLWAHEGHAPLSARGASVVRDDDGHVRGVFVAAESGAALGVELTEVHDEPLAERLLGTAALVSPWGRHAIVTSPLPGWIESVKVRPGDVVHAGQVLAAVRTLELETIQMDLLHAWTGLKLAEKDVAELAPLVRQDLASWRELREAQTRLQEHRNARDLARGKLVGLGLREEDTRLLAANLNEADLAEVRRKPRDFLAGVLPIVSPIDGTVVHAELVPGKFVGPAEHLVEVVDLSVVWVKIGVVESDWLRIQLPTPRWYGTSAGPEVEIFLAAHAHRPPIKARLVMKDPAVDPVTRLGSVWAVLGNPPDRPPLWLPGMRGQAEVILEPAAGRRTVPADAVLFDGMEHFVLVETSRTEKGSTFTRQPVAVGARSSRWAEIEGVGLLRGDRILVKGNHELAEFFAPEVVRLSPAARRGLGVRVADAEIDAVEEIARTEGLVVLPPDRQAVASVPLTGSLWRIHVHPGQHIAEGQLLAELFSLEWQDLQLEYLRSYLQSALRKELLDQFSSRREIVSDRQWREAEAAWVQAYHQAEALERKLSALGLTLEQIDAIRTQRQILPTLPVRAARAGRVARFEQVLGQGLRPEQPLASVEDDSQVWVQAFVSEPLLARLPDGRVEGLAARVRFPARQELVVSGRVQRSGRTITPDGRTLAAWIELDSPAAGLTSGMLADVTLVLGKRERQLVLPRDAVARDGVRHFVFVERSDGVFERRSVQLGRADDRTVEILRGLLPGERVAVSGADALLAAFSRVR